MKASHTRFRRAALCIALGACIAATTPTVFAQSVTGAVAGRASAGDQITVRNEATGASRTVTVGGDGNYRLGQLPIGDYELQLVRNGQVVGDVIPVSIQLGGTTTVNLGGDGGLTNLDSVQVIGARVVNRVDVYSTESATNIRREEIARLPVDQNLASVALLAPGVVSTGATFGGLTFGGSTVAENAVYINGLNVTDPFRRQGFSTVPFGFYEEFQIKTGGYSAEFGRSTGGVINAVTRSGSNEFEAGMEVTLEPADWRASGRDRYYPDGKVNTVYSRDTNSWFKTNAWASGPIVEDRLFFFAMYEKRENRTRGYGDTTASFVDSPNDFWGVKLDWQISDGHLLELLAFSDEVESVTDRYNYDWDTDTRGNWFGNGYAETGGQNYSLTYTGHLTDNFVAKAMHGVNERSSVTGSPLDGVCTVFVRTADYDSENGEPDLPVGCHPTNSSISSRDDTREASRLDFEWTLGNHQLRFGVDQEILESVTSNIYPGDGQRYSAVPVVPGGPLSNGSLVPAGVTGILDARRYIQGAEVESTARALYIEDNWNITPNLLLNLGLRFDSFESEVGGDTFTKAEFGDMMAPRFGFSWDVKGDGSTKLFGNAGRYYIPMTNRIPEYFGGGSIDEHTFYVIDGWQELPHPVTGDPYLAPIIGDQIGPVDGSFNAGGGDFRTVVDRDLKQVYQDEFILGFQQALNREWSWGVNATYRETGRAIEDALINSAPDACPWYSGDWPIINPGETATLWCPTTEEWFELDTGSEGYRMLGSGIVVGYPKPKRVYKALEFQLDRAWDDKWAFNASYLWSRTEGNIEGPVNSDLGYADTGMVQYFDHPAGVERYGVLFNDYRHQFKFRGSYKFNEMWSVGSTLTVRSGGPITAFGVLWPNDNRAGGSFTNEFGGGGTGWLCVQYCITDADGNPSTYEDRVFEYTERGAFGRMPWVYNLGANVTWTLPVEGVDLKARLSVYNLLNKQTTINVHSRYEAQPGEARPYFGEGRVWQSPRYAQLVVTWNF
ncbi:TonB-dependent receptor [Luteimonas kalidii]|uniref:TonB-dependent receptor n=1 Tax=Luteimonas kalidii TaxID=3042025 RepID=A0ABT6JTS4_9GAMM|nr:TonB-dependent receptor [Luteimonas kalidii]MDH5833551.1 TonB-dependent receptor [Luteimonas kalidii]